MQLLAAAAAAAAERSLLRDNPGVHLLLLPAADRVLQSHVRPQIKQLHFPPAEPIYVLEECRL